MHAGAVAVVPRETTHSLGVMPVEVGWSERRHDSDQFAGGKSVATLARGIPKKGVTA